MSTGVRESGALRVAVLGCGSVGLQVVRLLHEQAGDLTARGRPGGAGRDRGAPPRRPRDIDVPDGLLTTDAAGLRRDVDLVIEVIGGIEPGALADPVRPRERRLGRHREQGAAGRGRPDPVRGGREGRAGPLLRGRRRGCHPDPARCASRWRGTGSPACSASSTARRTSSSTRWTPPAPVHGGARGGTGARVRRGRPDRRRRGLRRRGQGRDPRLAGVPLRVTAADVHREGISEVTAADVQSARDMGSVVKLLAICELRADPAATTPCPSGCTRR